PADIGRGAMDLERWRGRGREIRSELAIPNIGREPDAQAIWGREDPQPLSRTRDPRHLVDRERQRDREHRPGNCPRPTVLRAQTLGRSVQRAVVTGFTRRYR